MKLDKLLSKDAIKSLHKLTKQKQIEYVYDLLTPRDYAIAEVMVKGLPSAEDAQADKPK